MPRLELSAYNEPSCHARPGNRKAPDTPKVLSGAVRPSPGKVRSGSCYSQHLVGSSRVLSRHSRQRSDRSKSNKQAIKPMAPGVTFKRPFLTGFANALSGRFVTGIKHHLIDELCGRRPRLNLFANHVVFTMLWRFLYKIKPAGHGDFEVSKATLQHPGSNNAILAMPTCIGEAKIHLAGPEDCRERFGLAESSAIQAGGRL